MKNLPEKSEGSSSYLLSHGRKGEIYPEAAVAVVAVAAAAAAAVFVIGMILDSKEKEQFEKDTSFLVETALSDRSIVEKVLRSSQPFQKQSGQICFPNSIGAETRGCFYFVSAKNPSGKSVNRYVPVDDITQILQDADGNAVEYRSTACYTHSSGLGMPPVYFVEGKYERLDCKDALCDLDHPDRRWGYLYGDGYRCEDPNAVWWGSIHDSSQHYGSHVYDQVLDKDRSPTGRYGSFSLESPFFLDNRLVPRPVFQFSIPVVSKEGVPLTDVNGSPVLYASYGPLCNDRTDYRCRSDIGYRILGQTGYPGWFGPQDIKGTSCNLMYPTMMWQVVNEGEENDGSNPLVCM